MMEALRLPTKAETKKIWAITCANNQTVPIKLSSPLRILKRRIAKKSLEMSEMAGQVEYLLNNWYFYFQIWDKGFINVPDRGIAAGSGDSLVFDLAILAHELTHRDQVQRDDVGPFYCEYLMRPDIRALREAYAKASEADVFRLFGMKPPTGKMLFGEDWRVSYRVNAGEALTATTLYDSCISKHNRKRFATKTGAMVCKHIQAVMR